MTPRRRSALLWGVVGAFAFLALHGTYLLFGGAFLGVGSITVVTGIVFGATAVASYHAERRFGPYDRRLDDSE